MTNSPASIDRFVMTHEGHGGEIQVVEDHVGREWVQCTRCGTRILKPSAPPDAGPSMTR